MPKLFSRGLSRQRLWSSEFSLLLLFSTASLLYSGDQTQQTPPVQRGSASKSKPADEIQPGPQEKLDGIVTKLKSGLLPETRIIAIINKRGIDFVATPENLTRLKSAGATQTLIDLVYKLNPPPPPPKREIHLSPPVTGTLRFVCAPAECNIRVDGGLDKITKEGALIVSELVFKEYTVDFRKEGYVPQSEKITVTGENSPEIRVTLEVLPETRAEWGKELFKAAVHAVGGSGGLAELKAMTGMGGASSWSAAGAQSEWTIKTAFSGDTYSYELNNPSAGTFAISCQDETCGSQKGQRFGHKKASGPDADALNTNLRQYNRFHLEALLKRISDANHKLMANAAPGAEGAERHLMVESPDESYDITLDGAFLPIAVSYRSKDGLATAKISYAQYESFTKGAQYPRLTSIALPGDNKHGIRVKYDSVVQGAK